MKSPSLYLFDYQLAWDWNGDSESNSKSVKLSIRWEPMRRCPWAMARGRRLPSMGHVWVFEF